MAETDDVGLLTRGAVTLAPGTWDVLRAEGADRLRFLHGLLTADIQTLAPGSGTRACLLDAKGHVVSDLRVLVRENDILLLVAQGQGAPSAAALGRYAIMDDCRIEVAAGWGVLPVLGPEAMSVLMSVDPLPVELPDAELSHRTSGSQTFARVRQLGAPGIWVIAPGAELATAGDALERAGVPRLTAAPAEAARIAAGEPAWGREISSARFPLEVGLSHTIAYGKGCYLGQEPIVRIRDRGHVNWLLRAVSFAGELLPEPGDELEHESRPKAGTITSAAFLPDGRGVALALVHSSLAPPAHVAVRRGERLVPASLSNPAP